MIKIKKIVISLIFVFSLVGLFNLTAISGTANASNCKTGWNLVGNLTLSIVNKQNNLTYSPVINISSQSSNGTLSGTGSFGGQFSPLFQVTGKVNSNNVTFNLLTSPTSFNLKGSILRTGTLNGVWNSGTWNSTSGLATSVTVCN